METKQSLYKALADFQQEVPVILKEAQGYGYTYADLPKIFEVINPLMKKHKLGFTQLINDDKLKTIVFHTETGESFSSDTHMPFDSLSYEEITKIDKKGVPYTTTAIRGFEGMNKAQAIGSIITYFRRYAISSILGLVTDKDTDGAKVVQKDNSDLPF